VREILEASLKEITKLLRDFLVTESIASQKGVLQSIDARVKLVSLFILVFFVAISDSPPISFFIIFLSFLLAVLSKIPLRAYAARVTLIPAFSFVVVLPWAFLTEGAPLLNLPLGLKITHEGMFYVTNFTARVFACVSLLVLLILTTRFSSLLSAMRALRLPSGFVSVLAIAYRYMFLFLNEVYRLLVARESRTFKHEKLRKTWRLGGETLGVFFLRALERGERVHLAAVARGYSAEVKTYTRETQLKPKDFLFLLLSLLLSATVILHGVRI